MPISDLMLDISSSLNKPRNVPSMPAIAPSPAMTCLRCLINWSYWSGLGRGSGGVWTKGGASVV